MFTVRVPINKLLLAPPEADNDWSRGHAQKQRRFGYGRIISLIFSCIDLPVSHVSNVAFAALTGNPVNHAISFIRINRYKLHLEISSSVVLDT